MKRIVITLVAAISCLVSASAMAFQVPPMPIEVQINTASPANQPYDVNLVNVHEMKGKISQTSTLVQPGSVVPPSFQLNVTVGDTCKVTVSAAYAYWGYVNDWHIQPPITSGCKGEVKVAPAVFNHGAYKLIINN
tara:strand:+ start:5567 stop:5971 length:405 start_codon:yes stop_codon:yes gene_type:complete